ncbi:MAG: toll/interleukin-1 receptor domain-containing protein [Alphaproteobacteria bacterium]|nr:toll/interleukin-1 receptor domain-containing protein [Alphaproteobacteria bacterium]
MVGLFFSYSHKDEGLRNQLETHLAMLKRQGLIESWHDRRIDAGDKFGDRIAAELDAAGVILFLVSPDFLASDYCYDVEMSRALERDAAGEAWVIPVILRPCDWPSAPFGSLLALPKDGKPVTTWTNLDEAFLDIAQGIRKAMGRVEPQPLPHHPSAPKPIMRPLDGVRSRNLRITKKFTEQDHDAFRAEAFEYIARFFANSLDELQKRHGDVTTNLRQIDANRFTAAAYRGGAKLTSCTIFLGGSGGASIGYANRDSGTTSTYNEMLYVEHDTQSLFLKPIGMLTGVGWDARDAKLTLQGAAEGLWADFIQPMQRR